MNFTTFLKKTNAYLIVFIGFSLVTSCGSYQYVGVYEDGIYGDSETQEYNTNGNNDVSDNGSANNYYSDYFKGKSNEYNNNQETIFTDAEDYDSSYSPNNTADNNYAGWGQNSDSNVIINIQSRPNYGMGWGWNNWGWNNWGWNTGWNRWGWNAGWNWGYPNYYGYWDPFLYNGWNAPYWGGYGVGFYTPYRNQNIAYVNGNRNNALSRNSSYRLSSLSNRSALGTVSRVRRNNAQSTRTSTRQYKTTRPTVRTTTTTRSVRSNNGTVTATRTTKTTTKPRSTSSSSRTIKANTSRVTPRSSTYSRSSSRPSYSRSSGSSSSPRRSTSTRPRRN
jgi:hypothetical protein